MLHQQAKGINNSSRLTSDGGEVNKPGYFDWLACIVFRSTNSYIALSPPQALESMRILFLSYWFIHYHSTFGTQMRMHITHPKTLRNERTVGPESARRMANKSYLLSHPHCSLTDACVRAVYK